MAFYDPTPPAGDTLSTALHVIATERDALSHLESLYRSDAQAQRDLERAVHQLVQTIKRGGKLVICGVGKSGKIARKLEATMNSVGIHSVFLHPTEALHGDLGMIRAVDTLLLISFSGRTAELLLMLPHIPPTVPIIAITAHSHPASCPLLSYNTPDMTILLPAPLHIDEETSFGLSAPTSSTTVALALGDALALATARNLHTLPGQGPSEVFKGFHPGGAIGAATAAAAAASSSVISTPKSATSSSSLSLSYPSTNVTSPSLPSLDAPTKLSLDEPAQKETPTISDFLVPVDAIPVLSTTSSNSNHNNQNHSPIRLLDILLSAIQNPPAKSWVRLSPTEIIPPRRVRSLITTTTTSSNNTPQPANLNINVSVDTPLCQLPEPASIPAEQWLPVRASSPIDDVRMWVEQAMAKTSPSSSFDQGDDIVVSVVDDMDEDKIVGFVSVEEIWPPSMNI
ncbi:sugar isomerase, KpsF/GutQ [Talaromyces islandicus]|uniref:Sugar isomerase, KpsF/GutQ n=1 Tax=Talaromyces islandicus TaxID=28573 RepID=A0A0U1M6R2_TALIS|nr:sugar isomerase, KpsF/GutQ [Talaromyces islandicus]